MTYNVSSGTLNPTIAYHSLMLNICEMAKDTAIVTMAGEPYPSFQMVPFSVTLSDLSPTFQGHDNIQHQITRLIVSRV